MAEEYFRLGEVCGGNWWNSSRNIFGSSMCSNTEMGNFGWPSGMIMNLNARFNGDSCSPSEGSIVVQGVQTPQQPGHWNQDFFHENGRISEGLYAQIQQENLKSRMNYLTGVDCPHIQDDWNSTNWGEESSIKTSSLLKSLFDADLQPHDSSLLDNGAMNRTNHSNEFSSSFPQFSPLIKPSLAYKQPSNHFQLSNNTTLLNATAASLKNIRAGIPSTQSQFPSSNINAKRNLPKVVNKETRELSSVTKKTSTEPALKRARIETSSSLPTFKVRKEKLGDRITVLQQLVSPFGKTDTASVLQEAIEYIKFLHHQVSALSTTYKKSGSSVEFQQAADKFNNKGRPKEDLKSQGLCLVPISSTFPVASETATDFWMPTF